jgi:hypothetical protein
VDALGQELRVQIALRRHLVLEIARGFVRALQEITHALQGRAAAGGG